MKRDEEVLVNVMLFLLMMLLVIIAIVNFVVALEQVATYRDTICILAGWEMERGGKCVVLTGERAGESADFDFVLEEALVREQRQRMEGMYE